MPSTFRVDVSLNNLFCRQAPIRGDAVPWLVTGMKHIAQGRTGHDVVPVDRHRHSY